MELERNIELSSFETPQESDMAHARAVRASCAQQLEQVRQHIWQLQEAELALVQRIHHCNVVLAPIRLIPDDVLREIFTQTLPRVVRMTFSSAPLLLMHVCRRWRQVAGTSGPLWKCLPVDGLHSARAAAVILQLQHSAIESAPSILTSIASTLTRLSLHRVPLRLLIHPQPNSFPSLERLIISPRCEFLGGDISIQAFKDTPRLRYVSMCDWGPPDVQVILPWRQLTHFLCEKWVAARYLPSCTSLIYFLCDEDDSDWVDLPIGHFEQLEGLGFKAKTFLPIDTFFEKYEVVNLKSLRLQDKGYTPDWTTFQHVVSSHCSNLTHLSFSFVAPTDQNLYGFHDFFGSLQCIQTLDLEMIGDWDPLFQAFKWCDNDRHQQLLPHLCTLIICPRKYYNWSKINAIPIPTIPFLSFISSRMARALEERISKIVAYPSEPLDPLLIQQYVDNGLVYEEYPVGDTPELWFEVDGWMDSDPALHDWPELRKCL